MCCILRIYGDDFDVDRFIAETGLTYIAIHHKGEPVFKSKPDGRKIKLNGINISLSDADFEDHQIQVADAIAFLNQNNEKLMLLKSTPGIDSPTIDFGVEYPDDTDFCRSFEVWALSYPFIAKQIKANSKSNFKTTLGCRPA